MGIPNLPNGVPFRHDAARSKRSQRPKPTSSRGAHGPRDESSCFVQRRTLRLQLRPARLLIGGAARLDEPRWRGDRRQRARHGRPTEPTGRNRWRLRQRRQRRYGRRLGQRRWRRPAGRCRRLASRRRRARTRRRQRLRRLGGRRPLDLLEEHRPRHHRRGRQRHAGRAEVPAGGAARRHPHRLRASAAQRRRHPLLRRRRQAAAPRHRAVGPPGRQGRHLGAARRGQGQHRRPVNRDEVGQPHRA